MTTAFVHVSKRGGWPELGLDAPCCMGSAVYGADRCTCWRPVYDQEQQPARSGPMPQATKCCGDCAFRNGSPERSGDARMAHSDPGDIDEIVHGGRVFACHLGMRRVRAYVHPTGARVEADPGCYAPPIEDGVAYRADGSPATKCAGLRAMRLREGLPA